MIEPKRVSASYSRQLVLASVEILAICHDGPVARVAIKETFDVYRRGQRTGRIENHWVRVSSQTRNSETPRRASYEFCGTRKTLLSLMDGTREHPRGHDTVATLDVPLAGREGAASTIVADLRGKFGVLVTVDAVGEDALTITVSGDQHGVACVRAWADHKPLPRRPLATPGL